MTSYWPGTEMSAASYWGWNPHLDHLHFPRLLVLLLAIFLMLSLELMIGIKDRWWDCPAAIMYLGISETPHFQTFLKYVRKASLVRWGVFWIMLVFRIDSPIKGATPRPLQLLFLPPFNAKVPANTRSVSTESFLHVAAVNSSVFTTLLYGTFPFRLGGLPGDALSRWSLLAWSKTKKKKRKKGSCS